MRTPKPVKAWAPVHSDGGLSVEQGQIPVFVSRKDAKFDCEMANDGSKPIRVAIVPDGAASTEAECRRLRRENKSLRSAIDTLNLALRCVATADQEYRPLPGVPGDGFDWRRRSEAQESIARAALARKGVRR